MITPIHPQEKAGLFPTTRWTVIGSLAGGECSIQILAWEEFHIAYWRPLYQWLRLRGVAHENAEDLVQNLFTKLHGSTSTIFGLHPSKGKLRSFLLTALRNAWIDTLRAHTASESRLASMPAHSPSLQDDCQFDREWAIAILARSVAILRDEYSARGNLALFDALLPLIENDDSTSRNDASNACGLAGNTFNVALKRLRERLASRLRSEVAATLLNATEQDIDEELRHLIVVLARGGLSDALAPQPS